MMNEVLQNDYYFKNNDWHERTLEDNCEIVKYQNDSTIRIWYNEQTAGFAKHWHTAVEIIMPVENYYDVAADGRQYHVQPGEILLIPSGEMHQLIAPKSGKRFIFLFDISNISKMKGYAGINSLITGCLYITPETHPLIMDTLYQLLIQMRNEYFNSSDFCELSIYSKLINFFVIYGRNQMAESSVFHNVRSYKQKEYMQKFSSVLDYIDQHHMEDLTLCGVASYSGFSKFHFTRLFKEYTGYTFNTYLCATRVKAAEALLAQMDLSITEIALQSGFSSISSFNRTFRQIKNCSPTQFRALCSHNND